jgi:tetratricopeptide (TPR) repeat protein
MIEMDREAHELYELGLQHMWEGEVDAALDAYARAFAVAESDDVRELITIRKAEAMIATDRDGLEVSALPGIVLRRRSPRHVYLAAYALMRKFSEANERQRALFYGQIASKSSDEMGEPLARANVLNGLGVILAAESKLRDAVEAFDKALGAIAFVADQDTRILALRAGITANLGGTKVLLNVFDDGIALIESAIERLDADVDRAEAYLDLAVGYLGVEKYEVARRIALLGLELASTRRQVRNANHLLGEICVRTNRYDEADKYFDVVAGFYPDFANVKQLLVAVDLCSVVNWKA